MLFPTLRRKDGKHHRTQADSDTLMVCVTGVRQPQHRFHIGYLRQMTTASPDVLVIGAGVSGLSTAISLLDAGLGVTVRTASLPQRTTSAVAGALWGPHLVGTGGPASHWAAQTLERLRALTDDPAAGVSEISGLAASRQPDAEPPGFTSGVGPLTPCGPAELPAGYAAGWRYLAPVATMPVYLDYLTDRLTRQGGHLHLGRPFGSLAEATSQTTAPVIVNCAGIGARELVPDPDLVPVRGQVVIVANPGLTEFFVGEHDDPELLTYFFPRGATVLLGGTAQSGNASTEPDQATAERIRRDCAAVEPRLADATVLAHLAGLRPVRPEIRLETQAIRGRHIVHNYGHGGAGVTVSWGCAQATTDLVLQLLG
jgi:D-amino-acid oxidase